MFVAVFVISYKVQDKFGPTKKPYKTDKLYQETLKNQDVQDARVHTSTQQFRTGSFSSIN